MLTAVKVLASIAVQSPAMRPRMIRAAAWLNGAPLGDLNIVVTGLAKTRRRNPMLLSERRTH
jgi:hypothetical protein